MRDFRVIDRIWETIGRLVVLSLLIGGVSAEPVKVRYLEGAVHGFLALRTLDGQILASGDLTQTVKGNRAVSHLRFRFRDGSIDDETAVFSQRGTFRLISDHHVQTGPAFPSPTDVRINAATGQVTVRYEEKGKTKVETEHLDLPPDVSNGIILDVLKNISPGSKETKLSYVAATPKPRLVHLSITPQGSETFLVAGVPNKATKFGIQVELGGISGLIAPFVGKRPENIYVWIARGQAPAFVKSEQFLYLGGPMLSIEMTSPVWRKPRSVARR